MVYAGTLQHRRRPGRSGSSATGGGGAGAHRPLIRQAQRRRAGTSSLPIGSPRGSAGGRAARALRSDAITRVGRRRPRADERSGGGVIACPVRWASRRRWPPGSPPGPRHGTRSCSAAARRSSTWRRCGTSASTRPAPLTCGARLWRRGLALHAGCPGARRAWRRRRTMPCRARDRGRWRWPRRNGSGARAVRTLPGRGLHGTWPATGETVLLGSERLMAEQQLAMPDRLANWPHIAPGRPTAVRRLGGRLARALRPERKDSSRGS